MSLIVTSLRVERRASGLVNPDWWLAKTKVLSRHGSDRTILCFCRFWIFKKEIQLQ